MDSNCKSAIHVILGIYWVISLMDYNFVRMPWKFHLILQKWHAVVWTAIFLWAGMKEKAGRRSVCKDIHMSPQTGKKKEKEEEGERDPRLSYVRPLTFIVIPLPIQQVGRNQCALASAVLRSALCSSVLELWASLLPAAQRFSCDPEQGLPQRLTNFITTFSQLRSENQPNSPTHNHANPTSSFP